MAQGGVPYSLKEILISAYDRDADTYSDTIVSLSDDHVLEVEPQHDTDEMRDSGKVSRLLSIKTYNVLTLGQGGMDFAALAVLIGLSEATSGVTPNIVNTYTKQNSGKIMPYFGVLGVVNSEEGGVLVAGLRACMLDVEPKYTFDGRENKFVVSEAPGRSVFIGDVCDEFSTYETVTLWESSKPSDGSTFKSWFSA